MTRAFNARYEGRCMADCGNRIEPGDTVIYISDELVHVECVNASKSPSKPEVICKSCWLVKPCDCED